MTEDDKDLQQAFEESEVNEERQHGIFVGPIPPEEEPVAEQETTPARKPIDWTKWGTILAGSGILVTILIAVLS